MTKRQYEIIEKNLHAFLVNFGPVRIESYDGRSFNLYYPADAPEGEYIQHCYDIDYLNGFLYGCVVGVLRVMHMDTKYKDDEWCNRADMIIKQKGNTFTLDRKENNNG